MGIRETFAAIRASPGVAVSAGGEYLANVKTLLEPPESFDWADHITLPEANLQDGQSCFANAIAAVLKSLHRKSKKILSTDPSHSHVCTFGYPIGEPIYSEEGALNRLLPVGMARPTLPPFFPGNENRTADLCRLNDGNVGIESYEKLYTNVEAMNWISGYGPIVAILELQDGLMESYRGLGIYRDDGSRERGKHAVMLYGYENPKYGESHWICQNSFGTKWGKSGRFRITMGQRSLLADNSHIGFGLKIEA